MFGFTLKAGRKPGAWSSKKTGPTIVFDIVPHHGNPTASSDIMVKTAKTHHYRQKAYLVPFSSREHDMILTQSKIKAFETHETVGRRHDKIPLASLEPVERFEIKRIRHHMKEALRDELRN